MVLTTQLELYIQPTYKPLKCPYNWDFKYSDWITKDHEPPSKVAELLPLSLRGRSEFGSATWVVSSYLGTLNPRP